MRSLLLIVPVFLLGCSTAEIIKDRDAVKNVKSVAIVPFRSAVSVKEEALIESEEKFRSALSGLNYKIVETDNPEIMQKFKEFSIDDIKADDVKDTGKRLGADAVLFGEITLCDQFQYNRAFHHAHRFGGLRSHRTEDMPPLISLRFRIIVKLADASDGRVVLTIKNRYGGGWYDPEQRGFDSLDAYRRYVLKKMTDELTASLKEKGD